MTGETSRRKQRPCLPAKEATPAIWGDHPTSGWVDGWAGTRYPADRSLPEGGQRAVWEATLGFNFLLPLLEVGLSSASMTLPRAPGANHSAQLSNQQKKLRKGPQRGEWGGICLAP